MPRHLVAQRVQCLTFGVIHHQSHVVPNDPLVCNRSDMPVNIFVKAEYYLSAAVLMCIDRY